MSQISPSCVNAYGLPFPNSGGYGSNGADGAASGNIFITVPEDGTDLLIPLEYDLQGGSRGASGQHGEPGDGGIGGKGGKPHAWYATRPCPAWYAVDHLQDREIRQQCDSVYKGWGFQWFEWVAWS